MLVDGIALFLSVVGVIYDAHTAGNNAGAWIGGTLLALILLIGVISWGATCIANLRSPTRARLVEVEKGLAENTKTLERHARRDRDISIGVGFLLRTSGEEGKALAATLFKEDDK